MSLARRFWSFIKATKKWWLPAIIIWLVVIGLAVLVMNGQYLIDRLWPTYIYPSA